MSSGLLRKFFFGLLKDVGGNMAGVSWNDVRIMVSIYHALFATKVVIKKSYIK